MTVPEPTPGEVVQATLHHTACTLDCPDSCSLEVEVRDGRVDKVRAAPPDLAHPLTSGFICSKVGRISRHLYGEDRLLHPARRTGPKGDGAFERISWEEALDLIVSRMTEARTAFGGESVLPVSYGGSNGLMTQDTADAILFRRFGASALARNVCAAPSTAAALGLYGKMAGVALEDYEHASLAIVWGANPSSTGIHLVPILRTMQARGGKLVVVDPRRTPLAKKADLHLQPQARHRPVPGSGASPRAVPARRRRPRLPGSTRDRGRGTAATRRTLDLRARRGGDGHSGSGHRALLRVVQRVVAGRHPLRLGRRA